MAKQLPILEFPDPRLRIKAKPVETFDAALKALVEDMFATMYAAPGIGLAAPQVGVSRQLLVLDVSEHNDAPKALINPEIISRSGSQLCEEGCLSVPGVSVEVERAATIEVAALDVDGHELRLTAEGLEAVCIQHEMDHLAGKLFVDYLSPLKRDSIRRRLEKQHRLAAVSAA